MAVASESVASSEAVTTPTLLCTCGASIPLHRERVGDSVSCPACKRTEVVLRSRTRGPVPAAKRLGGLSSDEREEIDEALRRIKLRRVGRASRHVQLYPSWAVFLAGVQFYLSGILAGQNLITVGQVRRGRFVQMLGVAAYLALGALYLTVALTFGERIPPLLGVAALAITPLAFATYFTATQSAPTSAAREHGATRAPVLLPLLLGLILAIAQAFAIWFLKLRLDGPYG